MTNLYCPNCHRQLHEIDIAMGICAMCGTLLDVEDIIEKYKAESEDE